MTLGKCGRAKKIWGKVSSGRWIWANGQERYWFFQLSRQQTICEKSARCKKHARREKLPRKKGAHKTTQIDYTRFMIRLFYPLSHEKIPLSCALLPLLLRDSSRHEKSVSWNSINNMKQPIHTCRVSHVFHISWTSCKSSIASFTISV